MKTSTYNAWWRELGAISRGMMFIEGHIATPIAVDPAPHVQMARPPARASARPARPPANQARKGFSLLEDLLFLGGRPMTAGHNLDLDEAFPQTQAEQAGSAQRPASAEARSTRGRNRDPACAGKDGAHRAATREARSTQSRALLSSVVLALVAVAMAWTYSDGPSLPSAGASARIAELPAITVRPVDATAAPASLRIVDLAPVTVRPQPADYALLAAENRRLAECRC